MPADLAAAGPYWVMVHIWSPEARPLERLGEPPLAECVLPLEEAERLAESLQESIHLLKNLRESRS